MQSTPFDQTFEQRLARIDPSKVMEHVVEDHGLSAADATRAEDLYRKYLTLKAMHSGAPIVPPRIVDLVWHAHITFTRQYMADCQLLFGEYLHHTPTDEDTTDMYEQGTIPMFENAFGINLYKQMLPQHYLCAESCS